MKIIDSLEKIPIVLIISLVFCGIYNSVSESKAIALETLENIQSYPLVDNSAIPSIQPTRLAQVNRPISIPELPPNTNPLPQPELPDSEDRQKVEIKTISVVGYTILTKAQIDKIIQPLIGKTVAVAELKLAIDELTQI